MSDDRKVTVCAGCLKAFCWLRPRSKNACSKRVENISVEKTVAELRELATGEHKSWWKKGAGESEEPRDEEDVRDLVEWYLKSPPKEGDPPRDAQTFTSYLVSQCGARRGPLKALLAEIYPAAALCIPADDIFELRDAMSTTSRVEFIRRLEAQGLHPPLARELLEEFDATQFPNQLPEPVRTKAQRRRENGRALFARGA